MEYHWRICNIYWSINILQLNCEPLNALNASIYMHIVQPVTQSTAPCRHVRRKCRGFWRSRELFDVFSCKYKIYVIITFIEGANIGCKRLCKRVRGNAKRSGKLRSIGVRLRSNRQLDLADTLVKVDDADSFSPKPSYVDILVRVHFQNKVSFIFCDNSRQASGVVRAIPLRTRAVGFSIKGIVCRWIGGCKAVVINRHCATPCQLKKKRFKRIIMRAKVEIRVR